MKCSICDKEVDNRHFWREHKMAFGDYMVKYFPKQDMWDGSPISWTGDETSYSLQDFNSRANMKAAMLSWPHAKAKAWCLDALKRRKEFKGMKIIPCEVELRSLILPPTQFMEKLFQPDGGFHQVMKTILGLKSRFDPIHSASIFPSSSVNFILVDTRENHPLVPPNIPVRVRKLDYGDYCSSENLSVFFERKSLPDLIGSLGQNYERFIRELDRAKNDGAYIVILVETPITTALIFNKLPLFKKATKMTPAFLFHRIREILQSWENVQFLFCDGRRDAAEKLEQLIKLGDLVKQTDLQYAKTLGLI